MEILRKLRFESLPLSLSGVILGILLAAADYVVDWKVAVSLFVATAFLHLSVNAEKLSKTDEQMKKASMALLAMTVVCGVLAVYFTFGTLLLMESFVTILLGYVIIRTARHSDLFNAIPAIYKKLVPIFLLTAVAPVYGAYYICSHSFGTWLLLLPSLAIGALNLAIVQAGSAVDVKGKCAHKVLQVILVLVSLTAMTIFTALRVFDIWHYLYLLSLPLFALFIVNTINGNAERSFKLILASTFVFSLLSGSGYVIFLLDFGLKLQSIC